MVYSESYKIKSYMTLSILCNLFCFFPFSVVGLIYSMKTVNYLKRGLLDEAFSASESAKLWDIISIIFVLLILFVAFLVSIA